MSETPKNDSEERPGPPETPTLDKITKVRDQSQAIYDFLHWLQGQGVTLGHYPLMRHLYPDNYAEDDDRQTIVMHPYPYSIRTLLYRFFDVDEQDEDKEKRALLEYIQQQSAAEA